TAEARFRGIHPLEVELPPTDYTPPLVLTGLVSYGKYCPPKSSGMCRNLHTASEIQPRRKLHLPRSKRAGRLHEARRLLIISRIKSISSVLCVLNELPCGTLEAIVRHHQPLIVAIKQIERISAQLQMKPSAQIHHPSHLQIHARVV